MARACVRGPRLRVHNWTLAGGRWQECASLQARDVATWTRAVPCRSRWLAGRRAAAGGPRAAGNVRTACLAARIFRGRRSPPRPPRRARRDPAGFGTARPSRVRHGARSRRHASAPGEHGCPGQHSAPVPLARRLARRLARPRLLCVQNKQRGKRHSLMAPRDAGPLRPVRRSPRAASSMRGIRLWPSL